MEKHTRGYLFPASPFLLFGNLKRILSCNDIWVGFRQVVQEDCFVYSGCVMIAYKHLENGRNAGKIWEEEKIMEHGGYLFVHFTGEQ